MTPLTLNIHAFTLNSIKFKFYSFLHHITNKVFFSCEFVNNIGPIDRDIITGLYITGKILLLEDTRFQMISEDGVGELIMNSSLKKPKKWCKFFITKFIPSIKKHTQYYHKNIVPYTSDEDNESYN